MNSPKNQGENLRRNQVVLEHLDRMVDDLVVMFEETYETKLNGSRRDLFRNKAKSILTYWLMQVYDEATSELKNLETALDTSRVMVRKLRESEQNLLAISSSLSSRPPENSLMTGVQKKMEAERLLKQELYMLMETSASNIHNKKTLEIKPLFPDVPEYGYRFSQEKLEENMKKNRQEIKKDPKNKG